MNNAIMLKRKYHCDIVSRIAKMVIYVQTGKVQACTF